MTGGSARLHACRISGGLSQDELAQRSALDVCTITNLERGRARWPYPDTVRRLADALGLRNERRDEFTAAAGRRLGRGAEEAGDGSTGEGAARPGDRLWACPRTRVRCADSRLSVAEAK